MKSAWNLSVMVPDVLSVSLYQSVSFDFVMLPEYF